jgi:NAD(P) transhydrogenase subunit alpha
VITTALIPGKPAPLLVTEEMVRSMKPGSVIVDLAAEMGGNCALTQRGAEVTECGVSIVGPLNLPSTMPTHASQMYSKRKAS